MNLKQDAKLFENLTFVLSILKTSLDIYLILSSISLIFIFGIY